MKRFSLHLLILCSVLFFIYSNIFAQNINSSVLSSSGSIEQVGGEYLLNSTIGQASPNGLLTGGQYALASGFSFTSEDVNLDIISPIIIHTAIVSSSVNQAIVIQANITDNKDVSQAILNFRKGGDTGFTSLLMLPTGSVFNGLIPPNTVELTGSEYYIEAIDSSGNTTREPSQGVYSVSVTILGEGLQKKSAQPSGSTQNTYRLISLPLSAENRTPSSVLTDDLGDYDKTKWRFFDLQADQSYIEFPNTTVLNPGKAFWLIVKDANKIIDTGPASSNKSNEPFEINLNAGWNFIGNPFNFKIPVENLSLANNQNIIIDYFSGSWNPFAGFLEPFEGYALFTENATTLIADPVIQNTNKSKIINKEKVKPIWEINIIATCQEALDANNILAVVPGSSKSWDINDRPEPPIVGEYISLYFPHKDWDKISKIYSKDVRPEMLEGDIWDIEVLTNINDIVKLSFKNLKNLPSNYEIKLVDHETNLIKDLKNSSIYEFNNSTLDTPRKLKLIIGDKGFVNNQTEGFLATPSKFKLFQNYPNPFNPDTKIQYSIPVTGHSTAEVQNVSLKIYDILGSEIITLVNEKKEPGNYEVKFDASKLNSGIYFYSIKSGNFNSTKKMLLLK